MNDDNIKIGYLIMRGLEIILENTDNIIKLFEYFLGNKRQNNLLDFNGNL